MNDVLALSASVRSSAAGTVTGQPAITVPLGETDGIPVAVQLVGPPARDDLVISLAAQLEDAIGRHPQGIAAPERQFALIT